MTRHSKNTSNHAAVFSYYERQQSKQSRTLRLPAAAIKQWYHCTLSLATASTPVITPHGVLYDRQAILLHLLHQKREIRRKRDEAEAEHKRRAKEDKERNETNKLESRHKFESAQLSLSSTPASSQDQNSQHETATPNFWLPAAATCSANQPETVEDRPPKRRRKDSKKLPCPPTLCPLTKKPLKSSHLITLNLTPLPSSKSDETPPSPPTSFMCPICQTSLTNASKPVALRTGTVVCASCAEDFVKPDALDPISNQPIDVQADIIPIYNTGTAFAASTPNDLESKQATLYKPSLR